MKHRNPKRLIEKRLSVADSIVSETPSKGLKILTELQDEFHKKLSQNELVRISTISAKAYSTLGENEKAKSILTNTNIDLLDIDKNVQSDYFLTFSTVEMLLNNHLQSIVYGKSVLAIVSDQTDYEKRSHAYVTIAQSQFALARIKDAKINAALSLRISQQISNSSRTAIALNIIAGCELALNKPESACKFYQDALLVLDKINTQKTEKVYATILNNLVNAQLLFCDYPNAVNNLKQACEIFEKKGDTLGYITTLINLGSVSMEINNFTEAFRCLYKVEDMIKKSEQEHFLSAVKINLANTFAKIGDYTRALEILKESLLIASKYKQEKQKCFIRLSMGNVYMLMRKNSKAKGELYKALYMAEKTDAKVMKSAICIALGDYYSSENNWHDGALQYLLAAELLTELKSVKHLAEAYSGAAKCFLFLDKPLLALEYIDLAIENSKYVYDKSVLSLIYENAGTVYEINGKNDQARKIYKQYLKMGQEVMQYIPMKELISVHTQNEKKLSSQAISDLNVELRRLKKENESLKKELKLQTIRTVHNNDLLKKIENVVQEEKHKDSIPLLITDILGMSAKSEYVWDSLKKGQEKTDSELTVKLINSFPSLTKMEIKICSLIWMGMSSKNIASMLFVEKITIDKHRQNIRKKLGIQPHEDIELFLKKLMS